MDSVDKSSTRFDAYANRNDKSAMLAKTIRAALGDSFRGKRILEVRVGRMEDDRVSGFLKVRGEGTHENFLLDFRATLTRSAISSLEVGGERVTIAHRSAFEQK